MAVIFSQISDLTATKLCKSKICKACGLYLNQAPVLDKQKSSSVFWVGLSAVIFEDGQEKLPLSPLTASGALIHRIEAPFISDISFYKTNIVKCVPLNNNKIRYPLEHEMQKCFPNFQFELEQLSPNTVFLLGKQVSDFVLKKLAKCKPSFSDDFMYETYSVDGINFIPIHHPSYILVYKRKQLDKYINNVQELFPIPY